MSQNKCYHYYLVSIWEEKWKEKIVEEEVEGKSYSRTMRVGLDNGGDGGSGGDGDGDEDFRKLITDGIWEGTNVFKHENESYITCLEIIIS